MQQMNLSPQLNKELKKKEDQQIVYYHNTHNTETTPAYRHYMHIQQQQQRKHSYSHKSHSRHTSSHSQQSHSLHSSPHQSGQRFQVEYDLQALTNNSLPRNLMHCRSSSHSAYYHQNHHRRRKRHPEFVYQHSDGNNCGRTQSVVGKHGHQHNSHASCTRRHRSTTDVSNASINTCHDPTCIDREVQDIFVQKKCCVSSSRTELAQYFAEDLYGTLRRPSSCCTSSDYCFQTDSTSIYGSPSTLSRNNSIKSTAILAHKRRNQQAKHQQRKSKFISISLCGLDGLNDTSIAHCQRGSLNSVFDRAKKQSIEVRATGKLRTPSLKSTLGQQTLKNSLSQDLPDYACSPSPIRWSFLTDRKSPIPLDGIGILDDMRMSSTWCDKRRNQKLIQRELTRLERIDYDEQRLSKSTAARKCRAESPYSDSEKSTTLLFHHQEGEPYNDCCGSNYIQCNTYLDQDLQITSEDIHQYLSKGNQTANDVLNNSKNYPFQPSNTLEFQYKNNFTNNNQTATSSECGDSLYRNYICDLPHNSSKETNLNQNSWNGGISGCTVDESSPCSTPMSHANINLSSSTNNINIIFNANVEHNSNEVKFINTARDLSILGDAHHSGYLPSTLSTYDYTNMSANSLFDKPIGIDQLPQEFATARTRKDTVGVVTSKKNSISSQHSSLLQSPTQTSVRCVSSYDSFDAASNHNLISQRDSFVLSTPLTPLSPNSPASSYCLSTTESSNLAVGSYINGQVSPHYGYHLHRRHLPASISASTRHHHHIATDGFKFANALKKVRRRARKYTEFLRKK